MVKSAVDPTLVSLLHELDEEQRAGRTPEAIAATWRFAGIADESAVRDWIAVGVFDGHHAGLLRVAGISAGDLARLPEGAGRKTGIAFTLGQLSVAEVRNVLDVFSSVGDSLADPLASTIRTKHGPAGGNEGQGQG